MLTCRITEYGVQITEYGVQITEVKGDREPEEKGHAVPTLPEAEPFPIRQPPTAFSFIG